MDRPQEAVPDGGMLRPPSRVRWPLLAAATLALSPVVLHRTSLIDPIPPLHTMLAGMIGFGIGFCFAARIEAKHGAKSMRERIGLLAIPIFMVPLATYYARLAHEAAAFANVASRPILIPARVTQKSHRGFIEWAWVQSGPGARQLQIRVSPEVHDALEPHRAPGRDCLLLDAEVGRRGMRRAHAPLFFEEGLGRDRLTSCALPAA